MQQRLLFITVLGFFVYPYQAFAVDKRPGFFDQGYAASPFQGSDEEIEVPSAEVENRKHRDNPDQLNNRTSEQQEQFKERLKEHLQNKNKKVDEKSDAEIFDDESAPTPESE